MRLDPGGSARTDLTPPTRDLRPLVMLCCTIDTVLIEDFDGVGAPSPDSFLQRELQRLLEGEVKAV